MLISNNHLITIFYSLFYIDLDKILLERITMKKKFTNLFEFIEFIDGKNEISKIKKIKISKSIRNQYFKIYYKLCDHTGPDYIYKAFIFDTEERFIKYRKLFRKHSEVKVKEIKSFSIEIESPDIFLKKREQYFVLIYRYNTEDEWILDE